MEKDGLCNYWLAGGGVVVVVVVVVEEEVVVEELDACDGDGGLVWLLLERPRARMRAASSCNFILGMWLNLCVQKMRTFEVAGVVKCWITSIHGLCSGCMSSRGSGRGVEGGGFAAYARWKERRRRRDGGRRGRQVAGNHTTEIHRDSTRGVRAGRWLNESE